MLHGTSFCSAHFQQKFRESGGQYDFAGEDSRHTQWEKRGYSPAFGAGATPASQAPARRLSQSVVSDNPPAKAARRSSHAILSAPRTVEEPEWVKKRAQATPIVVEENAHIDVDQIKEMEELKRRVASLTLALEASQKEVTELKAQLGNEPVAAAVEEVTEEVVDDKEEEA